MNKIRNRIQKWTWISLLFIAISLPLIGNWNKEDIEKTCNMCNSKTMDDSFQTDYELSQSPAEILNDRSCSSYQETAEYPQASGTEFSWDLPYQVTSPKIPSISLDYLKINCSDLSSLVDVSNMSLYIKNIAPFDRRFVVSIISISSIQSPLLAIRYQNGSTLPTDSDGTINLLNHTLTPGSAYSDIFYLLPSIAEQFPQTNYIDPTFFLRILIRFQVEIYVLNEITPYGSSYYETTIDCYRNVKEFNEEINSIVTAHSRSQISLAFPKDLDNTTVVECQDRAKPVSGTPGSSSTLNIISESDYTILEVISFDPVTNNILRGYININLSSEIEAENTTPTYQVNLILTICFFSVGIIILRIHKKVH